MAFFDELGKKAQAYAGIAVDKAKDLADTASEKAKTAAETAKVNMAIMMEQRELDKNYKAEEIPDAVKDVVEAVNASKAKSAELEASKPQKEEPIAEEEPAERVCPVCGVTANSKFCPECGAPMREPKE